MLSSIHEITSIFMGIEFSYENEASKCKNVLLVGNGFDLALGQKTKYSDFLLYLILIYSVYIALDEPNELDIRKFNIDDIEKGFESYPDLKFYFDIFKLRLSKSPLEKEYIGDLLEENKFTNQFLSMLLQEELSKSKDLTEEVISGHIKSSDATKLYIERLFTDSNDKTNKTQNKLLKVGLVLDKFKNIYDTNQTSSLSINGWLDVERFIEYLVLKESDVLQNKFYPKSNNRVKNCFLSDLIGEDIKNDTSTANEYFCNLQKFTDEFCCYLSTHFELTSINGTSNFVNKSNFSHAKSLLLQNLIIIDLKVKDELSEANIKGIDIAHHINSIIDFNYSRTTDILKDTILGEIQFNERDKLQGSYLDITHVNGSCKLEGEKNTAIFGYSRNEQKVDSSELNIEAFKFEKGSQRILKNVKTLDFEKIEQGGFNLIIFGFSCAPADADVIKPLLTSSELKVAVVLCHTENEMLSIYKNLTDILGTKTINNLLRKTTKLTQRLFLIVNGPSS